MQKLQSFICAGMYSAASWHNKRLLLYNGSSVSAKINTIL